MSSAAATLSDIGEAKPGPMLLVTGALVSMPLWIEALRELSEFAAAAAPVVGCLVGLVTLYKTLNGGRRDSKAKRSFYASLKSTAVEVVAKPGARSGVLLIVLALFATVAHMLPGTKRADATPLALLAAQPVTQKRRKTKDDAGEDGLAEAAEETGAPPWYAAALKLRGTHEGTKKKPNPLVQAMFADCGFPQFKDTTATPWCAAFTWSLMKRAGHVVPNSLMARSGANWGEPCEPKLGCLVVMWRGSPTSASGHIGFYAGENDTHVFVLGGNQSDAVTVAKFPKSRVLAYRWPRKASQLRTVKGAVTAAASSAGSVVASAVVIAEAVAPVQTPLQNIGTPVALSLAAKIAMGLAIVALVSALYAAARRIKDHKERGV